MKKSLLILMSMFLLLYFAGCGGGTGVTPEQQSYSEGRGTLTINMDWEEINTVVSSMQNKGELTGQIIPQKTEAILVEIWTVPTTDSLNVISRIATLIIPKGIPQGVVPNLPAGRVQIRFYAWNTALAVAPEADPAGYPANSLAERRRFVTIKPDLDNAITARLGITIFENGMLEPEDIIIDNNNLGKLLIWTNESFTVDYYVKFDKLFNTIKVEHKSPTSPGIAKINSITIPSTAPSVANSLVNVEIREGDPNGAIANGGLAVGTIQFIGSAQVKLYANGFLTQSFDTIQDALDAIAADTPTSNTDYKVEVSAGTYTEDLTLTSVLDPQVNSIELAGVDPTTTIIQAGAATQNLIHIERGVGTERPVYIHNFTLNDTATNTALKNLIYVESSVTRAPAGTLPASFSGAVINIGNNKFKAGSGTDPIFTYCINTGTFTSPANGGIDINSNTFESLSTIQTGGFWGIRLAGGDDASAGGVKIRQNTITGRVYNAIFADIGANTGTGLLTVSSNTVRTLCGPAMNDVTKSGYGIYINGSSDVDGTEHGVQVTYNKVNDDSTAITKGFYYGIQLGDDCGDNDNMIKNNTVEYNTFGFHLGDNFGVAFVPGTPEIQRFRENNIIKNTTGVYVGTVAAPVIFGNYNFWGSPAGAGQAGNNGINEDAVAGRIDTSNPSPAQW